MTEEEHPRRKAILEILASHPGCSFRRLARLVGMPTGCARHHLTVLERERRAWSTRFGGRLAIFRGPKPERAEWVAVHHLPDGLDRRLLGLMQHGPVRGQQAFFDACQGTSRSTLQHRLARLQRWGLLTVRFQGRWLIYTLAPGVISNGVLQGTQEVPA